jgi:hypothetical protein
VIGPQWLRVTDDYGRRRIDRDDDWLRSEISHALQKRERILPVILSPNDMPHAEALPEEFRSSDISSRLSWGMTAGRPI